MAWTIGAHHDLTGSGTVAVSGPDALAIVVTSVGPHSNVRVGQPPTYYGLGHLSPGGSSGHLRDIPLQHVSQLEVLPTNEITSLGYTLQLGTEITVTELRAPTAVVSEPWRRNPTPIAQMYANDVGGGFSKTTVWTYTVPSGKWLHLSRVSALAEVVELYSTFSTLLAQVEMGSTAIALALVKRNALGAQAVDQLAGAELLVPAGTVLTASITASATGGRGAYMLGAAGFTFDA